MVANVFLSTVATADTGHPSLATAFLVYCVMATIHPAVATVYCAVATVPYTMATVFLGTIATVATVHCTVATVASIGRSVAMPVDQQTSDSRQFLLIETQ